MSAATVAVAAMAPPVPDRTAVSTASLDAESREWLRSLRGDGAEHDDAIARLRDLLVRAARFEVNRRRASLPHVRGDEFDEIAEEAADDALMSVLARLDDFRGASRFTTWVYKFALLEAAVKLRKRAWQGREVPLQPEAWDLVRSTALDPAERAEQTELLTAVQAAIATGLTPHQRDVLVSLAIDGVPIDVLADRMSTTRGALYKTLHDARRKLRAGARRHGARARRTVEGRPMTDRPDLDQVLSRVLGPAEPEVGCDECFDELDRYVDLTVAGADADAAVPGLRAHLAGCPACREEFESLRDLVAAERSAG